MYIRVLVSLVLLESDLAEVEGALEQHVASLDCVESYDFETEEVEESQDSGHRFDPCTAQ